MRRRVIKDIRSSSGRSSSIHDACVSSKSSLSEGISVFFIVFLFYN